MYGIFFLNVFPNSFIVHSLSGCIARSMKIFVLCQDLSCYFFYASSNKSLFCFTLVQLVQQFAQNVFHFTKLVLFFALVYNKLLLDYLKLFALQL